MLGRIDRQQVQSAQPLVQEQRFSRQTVATEVPVTSEIQEPRSARVARALFDFGGKALDARVQHLRSEVELDKITQTQRAIEGLDPTDDATVAGVRANRTVKMRDDVLQANNQIAEWTRANPDASDDDYLKFSREVFRGVLGQYEDDPTMTRAASARIQEAQVQVHQIRAAAKRQQQEFEAADNFSNAVQLYRDASQSPEDLLNAIQTEVYQEGRAMGVLEETQRNILMQQARRDAKAGDPRLLDALEQTDWGKSDLRTQQARSEYQSWEASRAAVDIGDSWADIQVAWKTRDVTWEQTAEAIRQLNERHPNSISKEQVASLKQQGEREQGQQDNLRSLMLESLQGGIPLSLRHEVPDSDKRAVVGLVSEQFDLMAEQLLQDGEFNDLEGVDPALAAYHWGLTQKINYGNANLVKVPEVSTAIDQLRNYTPKEGATELPGWANTVLFSMGQLDGAALDLYADDKTVAFYQNYQKWSEEEGDVEAFNRAWRHSFGSKPDPEELRTLREQTVKAVSSETTSFIRKLPFTGKQSAPQWQNDIIAREVMDYSRGLLASGATDIERVVEASLQRFTRSHTQLNAGTFVRGTEQELATSLGFLNNQGVLYRESGKMVQESFQWLFEKNKDTWQLESRIDGLTIRDVNFDINPRSGFITPRDTFGNAIGEPVHLTEMGQNFIAETQPNRAARAIRRRDAEREYREQTAPTLGRDPYYWLQ